MPRQRIEAEDDVRAILSQLRQIASVYANPAIRPDDIPATWAALKQTWWSHAHHHDQSSWDFVGFLSSQLSDDELETISALLFREERIWLRDTAAAELRRRVERLMANLGLKRVEMVFLVLGAPITKSWTAVKTLNSLLNAKDHAKRRSRRDVLDAVAAAALRRHAEGESPAASPPELAIEDVDSAFRAIRPGEDPDRASRRGTPALGSRASTPALIGRSVATPSLPAASSPFRINSVGPASSRASSPFFSAREESPQSASAEMPPPPRPSNCRKRSAADLSYQPPPAKRSRTFAASGSQVGAEEEEEEEEESEVDVGRGIALANDPVPLFEDGDLGDEAWQGGSQARANDDEGPGLLFAGENDEAGEEAEDEEEDDADFAKSYGKLAEAVLGMPKPRGGWAKTIYGPIIESFRSSAKVVRDAAAGIEKEKKAGKVAGDGAV
ncbi:hypothetical protein EsH8_XV_000007 [Colletotrichum jinshuiense]